MIYFSRSILVDDTSPARCCASIVMAGSPAVALLGKIRTIRQKVLYFVSFVLRLRKTTNRRVPKKKNSVRLLPLRSDLPFVGLLLLLLAYDYGLLSKDRMVFFRDGLGGASWFRDVYRYGGWGVGDAPLCFRWFTIIIVSYKNRANILFRWKRRPVFAWATITFVQSNESTVASEKLTSQKQI